MKSAPQECHMKAFDAVAFWDEKALDFRNVSSIHQD